MTEESRTFIGLDDFVSVQFECLSCGCKTSIPLAAKNRSYPTVCQNCKNDWSGLYNTPTFVGFLDSLAVANTTKWIESLQASIKLRVGLELKPHEEKE